MNSSMRTAEQLDPTVLSSRHVFRGIEYVVTLMVDNDKEVFSLEIEDRLTSDQWRGQFDARYIEDLTHKTGNFKQFTVFVNMLESALSKNSNSVSVDLLTYGDLESLRSQQHQRPGFGTQHIPGAKTRSQLHSKRYLIMTYTVEFDRIHYPLPLPYVGKPDPVQLQETIRKLRQENQLLKEQLIKGSRSVGLSHLQKENDKLVKEKMEIEKKLETFQREVKHVSKANTAKEIRVLKKVVQNLESDLMKEKSKFQRTINKKNEEHRNLLEELEEIRANERNLRARCRSLTNELAVLKRGPRPSPVQRNGSASSRSRAPRRSISKERPPSKQSSALRSRTPSPSVGRLPRFDPTAYVKERQRKQKEAEEARGRKRSRSGTRARSRSLSADRFSQKGPGSGGVNHEIWQGRRLRRTSSNGSLGSRRSSQSSVDRDYMSDNAAPPPRVKARSTKGSSGKKKSGARKTSWYSPEDSDVEKGTAVKVAAVPYSSTPEIGSRNSRGQYRPLQEIKNDSLNQSAEMMEIDARLNALQKFMKENMP
ncbi:centrosomal protein CCDC61-like isoform X1 [Montipora capricornis]|uniref:centrosomal protein CCDC61-like n=2 Tax=Montipora TaxID=46703 RepID=UPI0035F11DFF